MKITKELFDEALILEDALHALIGGYYGTHDLASIEESKEEYENRLVALKRLFNLKDGEYFCNFTFEDLPNPALQQPGTKGNVGFTQVGSTNSNTSTDTTTMKAGWYSDNFSTYYLDEKGVKHYC